jgi:hypothetical protein
VSSGDLSLIDLFVAARDDVEDLTRNVSFDTADCLQFGMALCYSPRHIFLGLWVKSQPSDCNDVERAVGRAIATSVQSVARCFA